MGDGLTASNAVEGTTYYNQYYMPPRSAMISAAAGFTVSGAFDRGTVPKLRCHDLLRGGRDDMSGPTALFWVVCMCATVAYCCHRSSRKREREWQEGTSSHLLPFTAWFTHAATHIQADQSCIIAERRAQPCESITDGPLSCAVRAKGGSVTEIAGAWRHGLSTATPRAPGTGSH